MKSVQKIALFACSLAVLSLPVLAHADDMMSGMTGMATDSAMAKAKTSTQGTTDKINAMKASGDQATSQANSTAANVKAMPQTTTDKMTSDMSGMPGMGK